MLEKAIEQYAEDNPGLVVESKDQTELNGRPSVLKFLAQYEPENTKLKDVP